MMTLRFRLNQSCVGLDWTSPRGTASNVMAVSAPLGRKIQSNKAMTHMVAMAPIHPDRCGEAEPPETELDENYEIVAIFVQKSRRPCENSGPISNSKQTAAQSATGTDFRCSDGWEASI